MTEMRRPARTAAGGIMYLWKPWCGGLSLEIMSTPKILTTDRLDRAAGEMANKGVSLKLARDLDTLAWHARAVLEKWSRDAA